MYFGSMYGVVYHGSKQNRRVSGAFWELGKDRTVDCKTASWQRIKQTAGISGARWVWHRDRQFLGCAVKGQTRGLWLLLLGRWFVSHGLPEGVISDKPSSFISTEFVAIIKLNCWHIQSCDSQVSNWQQNEDFSGCNKDRFFFFCKEKTVRLDFEA